MGIGSAVFGEVTIKAGIGIAEKRQSPFHWRKNPVSDVGRGLAPAGKTHMKRKNGGGLIPSYERHEEKERAAAKSVFLYEELVDSF